MYMREKYVDEKVGVWCIFGHDPKDHNLVDVNDGTNDVFSRVPKALAEKLVEAQRKFRMELYELMRKDWE